MALACQPEVERLLASIEKEWTFDRRVKIMLDFGHFQPC